MGTFREKCGPIKIMRENPRSPMRENGKNPKRTGREKKSQSSRWMLQYKSRVNPNQSV